MANEWGPPQSSDTPSRPSGGFDALLRKIASLQHQVDEMRSGLLRPAGLSVYPDGLTTDGDFNINGSGVVAGAFASADFGPETGWQLDGNNATFNTITLREGIIGDEALTNPVHDGSIGLSETAFTVPTTMSTVASGSMTIPAGFTRAAVLGIVSVGAWNGSGDTDYLYAQAYINGVPGATMPVRAAASNYGTVTVSAIRTLSGLSGGSLPVAARCYAAGGWGSDGSNIANIDVIAMFRR